jgi:hypothetical protein
MALNSLRKPSRADATLRQGFDDTLWRSQIGPSRVTIANHQKPMRLRRQDLAGKINSGHSAVGGFQIVCGRTAVERPEYAGNLGTQQIQERASSSNAHKLVPEATAV